MKRQLTHAARHQTDSTAPGCKTCPPKALGAFTTETYSVEVGQVYNGGAGRTRKTPGARANAQV